MNHDTTIERTIGEAAERIAAADAILACAGAGMGVDSGLPDFRGPEGFWRAYPAARRLGLRFEELANPRWFDHDPALAWGFYGHRMNLYRRTPPHPGFTALRDWCAARPLGGFVFTSNVDGHFEIAGFSPLQIVECHGSVRRLQCSGPCSLETWSSDGLKLEIDEQTLRIRGAPPICPRCGAVARPNVLMFGDGRWIADHTAAQEERFLRWLASVEGGRLVIVEIGAGSAVPTVRLTAERIARALGGVLVRINPREPEGPRGVLSLPLRGLEALSRIQAAMAALA